MRKFSLLLLVFLPIHLLLAGSTYDLAEALEKGFVKLEASGTGGHTNQSLSIRLTNLHKKKWELVIPAGFLFQSQDTSEQDLLVVRARTLKMEKGKNPKLRLHALCTQANNASPGLGSTFLAYQLASGPLLSLAQYLHKKRLSDAEAQDAVWAITDNHPISYIGNSDLAAFMAELLGKRLPGYTIEHQGRSRPGQPAFRDEPALVHGLLEYQTSTDCQASFGLYNAEGEQVVVGFENQTQRAGRHRFKFHFEILNLPKGKYYARMTSGDAVLGEMEVAF